MSKVTGFLEFEPATTIYEKPEARIRHSREFLKPWSAQTLQQQAARCMDCGTPYCHTGCPVNNQIPDWNDLVYDNQWEQACANLHSTNNFPEWTGRICPAPCEAACTLNLIDKPVTIKAIELAIVERGWEKGWIRPQLPKHKTGKSVGIIGAGPAGLAAAQQLARAGHRVTVYDRQTKAGGLLRYGIPDFKLEKRWIDRRLDQLVAEGIRFVLETDIGVDIPTKKCLAQHDAIILAGGAEIPRNLDIEGRELDGIHFAMDFLRQQNQRLGQESLDYPTPLLATDKHVIVIGGGDTGSDCIGTSFRQGARSVRQLEIMPEPPIRESKALSWPYWPLKLRSSTSHQEGAERDFAVQTMRFLGEAGKVAGLECVRLDGNGQPIENSQFTLPADLILLAMGFVHPAHEGLLKDINPDLDTRGNVQANDQDYRTSRQKIFACGDMRRGQSLVVWAIREGRQCAWATDMFLQGKSLLPKR